jgi:hypothetical protein
MPFPYYRRLSARNRAVYRRSDAAASVKIPDPAALAGPAAELRAALAGEERPVIRRRRVAAAVDALLRQLCRQLRVEPVEVSVGARRPRSARGELLALYVLPAQGRPRIEIWMQTARRRRVVAFRTFFRTLMHELCHHLDYRLLGLPESFHTEGFFRRESSLVRQILGRDEKPVKAKPVPRPVRKAVPLQMELAFHGRRT